MITIPIFYAIDDNYSKFVYVSIKSLIANRNKGYKYDINVKIFFEPYIINIKINITLFIRKTSIQENNGWRSCHKKHPKRKLLCS